LILRAKVIAVGSAPVPVCGFARISRQTATLLIELSDRSLGSGVAMLGCPPIPHERLAHVLSHAKSKVVQLAHLEFGVRMLPGRGFPKPLDRVRGVFASVVEHRPE
jgi:hypothetical protein